MNTDANTSNYSNIHNLIPLFQKCHSQNLTLGDQGQTFEDFLKMKGIQPNQEGTGRISFKNIKKVQCLFIKNVEQPKQKMNEKEAVFKVVKELIETYLKIPMQLVQSQLEYQKGNIIDRKKNLQYSIKTHKKKVNALDMLDLLVEYKNKNEILIAFIQEELHQNKEDIYGRACGDGVAIIDYTMPKGQKKQFSKFYETVIHETLHTLGFDHCLAFSCLMNPLIAGDMWLCPCCMKKIKSQLEQLKVDFVNWSQGLLNFFKKVLFWESHLIKKSQKILKVLKQIEDETELIAKSPKRQITKKSKMIQKKTK